MNCVNYLPLSIAIKTLNHSRVPETQRFLSVSSIIKLSNYQIIKFILSVFVAAFLVSCEIINSPEEIPSYIRISNIDFDPDKSGSYSHKIVDAWLEVDNEIIGTFELPATIPVLKHGTKKVKIYAGIYRDGIKGLRMIYPFYTNYDSMRTLVAGTIDTIAPVITYDSSVIFTFNPEEDFEKGTIFIKTSDGKAMDRVSNADSLFFNEGGNYIGLINAPIGNTLNLEVRTSGNGFTLPKKIVYLEINFKSNMDLIVGLYATKSGMTVVTIEKLVLYPAQQWKKIYISLTDEVAGQPNGTTFNIFFKASSLGDKNYYIALDNIKLIHF